MLPTKRRERQNGENIGMLPKNHPVITGPKNNETPVISLESVPKTAKDLALPRPKKKDVTCLHTDNNALELAVLWLSVDSTQGPDTNSTNCCTGLYAPHFWEPVVFGLVPTTWLAKMGVSLSSLPPTPHLHRCLFVKWEGGKIWTL